MRLLTSRPSSMRSAAQQNVWHVRLALRRRKEHIHARTFWRHPHSIPFVAPPADGPQEEHPAWWEHGEGGHPAPGLPVFGQDGQGLIWDLVIAACTMTLGGWQCAEEGSGPR